MTAKKIGEWICAKVDGMRGASHGQESISFEPDKPERPVIVTCGRSGMVEVPSEVMRFILDVEETLSGPVQRKLPGPSQNRKGS